jgi:hypothetical protein
VNAVAQETEHPLSKLELEDIFMVSSECRIAREYNQTDRSQPNLGTFQRMILDEQLYMQTRIPIGAPDERIQLLRFFAIGEVHVAKPGVKVPEVTAEAIAASTAVPMNVQWLKDEDKLASMKHVFAADYRCTDGKIPPMELLGTFANNVIFHAWPYWREAVHADCAHMRLPPITVPMLRSGKTPFSSPQILTSAGEMPVTSIEEQEIPARQR